MSVCLTPLELETAIAPSEDTVPATRSNLHRFGRTEGITGNNQHPHVRTTDLVVLSSTPRKFSTVSVTVNTAPTSSAVALSSASKDPLNGAKASRKAAMAARGVPVGAPTSHMADSEREAPPELALASNLTSPQRPTVCTDQREMR